jgi:proteasome lid subunit RPN8/RPN11
MKEDLKLEIERCALKRFPNEMVGCVVGGKFVELDNVSNEPENRYRLSAKDKVLIFEIGESLDALVHSHPKMDNTPSGADLKSQQMCQFPFWIIGTDGVSCTEIMVVGNE